MRCGPRPRLRAYRRKYLLDPQLGAIVFEEALRASAESVIIKSSGRRVHALGGLKVIDEKTKALVIFSLQAVNGEIVQADSR